MSFERAALTAGLALLTVACISGCGSFAPGRYIAVSVTTAAFRQAGPANVALANFKRTANFMPLCRTNFFIEAPEGQPFEAYIQQALQTELRSAGMSSSSVGPTLTLTGDVTELEFSTSTDFVNGRWSITLALSSSAGKSASFSETHKFVAGFDGHSACRRTAESFLPAVEKLMESIAQSQEFRALLTP